jgi:uncharacterized membrane protein YidH (DUF202 family)
MAGLFVSWAFSLVQFPQNWPNLVRSTEEGRHGCTCTLGAFLAALTIITLLLFSNPRTAELVVGNSCFLDQALRYSSIRIL